MTALKRYWALFLLAGIMGLKCADGQPTPACSFTFSFTAAGQAGAGSKTSFDNRPDSAGCVSWRVWVYTSVGSSTASVALETSPDNTIFTAVTSQACSSSVNNLDCQTDGVNPITGPAGTQASRKYDAWIRVHILPPTTVGTGRVVVMGYHGTDVSKLGGGNGTVGPSGPSGAPGPSGPAGATGSSGPAGATGSSGPSGPSGPAGGGGLYFLAALTAPPSVGWTWDNQGTSTIDSSAGYEYLVTPPQSATALSVRYRAAPVASSFTLTVAFIHDLTGESPGTQNASGNNGYGISVRDAGGKLVDMTLVQGGPNSYVLQTAKWTNSTTFSAAYKDSPSSYSSIVTDFAARYINWMRVVYSTGANTLTWFWSIDGQHWNQFDTHGATDFLAGVVSIGFHGFVLDSTTIIGLIDWTVV